MVQRVQPTQRAYSLAEYFALEHASDIKHEYFAGSIYAMVGASKNHNRIARNVLAALTAALRSAPYEPFGSDLRVNTPSGLYTYPDVSVLCAPPESSDADAETASNPTVLIEVLSDATRDYDQNQKFELFRAITTLREYVLIKQSNVRVELRSRTAQGVWNTTILTSLDDVLEVPSLRVQVTLGEIYERVRFHS